MTIVRARDRSSTRALLHSVGVTEIESPTDGRVARRQRNIDAVLDIVVEMFREGMVFPTIEQVATRAGLSLRSLYRYFPDPAALHEAAIRRHRESLALFWRLNDIGKGPFEERVEAFVSMRVRLFEHVAPTYRAATHSAPTSPILAKQSDRTVLELSEQFHLQFAPELRAMKPKHRRETADVADMLSQFAAVDFLRNQLGLSVAETETSLRSALTALLS